MSSRCRPRHPTPAILVARSPLLCFNSTMSQPSCTVLSSSHDRVSFRLTRASQRSLQKTPPLSAPPLPVVENRPSPDLTNRQGRRLSIGSSPQRPREYLNIRRRIRSLSQNRDLLAKLVRTSFPSHRLQRWKVSRLPNLCLVCQCPFYFKTPI